MILRKTKHPSVMVPTLWLLITPYHTIEYKHGIQKRNKITKETSFITGKEVFYEVNQTFGKYRLIKVKHNQRLHLQDKFIIESIWGYIQYTQKSKEPSNPENIDTFLKKVIDFTGIKKHKHTLKIWKEGIKRLQGIEIYFKYHPKGIPEQTHTSKILLKDYIITEDDNISIKHILFSDIRDTEIKKYLFWFGKSEKLYHCMDYMLLRVQQQKGKGGDAAHNGFYYRNIRVSDIMEYFGVKEDYNQNMFLCQNNIKESCNKAKSIRDFFTRMLKKLNDYSEKNGYEFPKYRLKGDMFIITDRCLKTPRTQKEMIEDIYRKVS